MKKGTFDFTPLKESNKKVDAIAAEVAKAEAEILLADEALAVAKRDDGTIAPEKLVKRIDDADRLLKIRRIEANRAAAKLEEVEGDLHRMVLASYDSLQEALAIKLDEEKTRIRESLKGILGESVANRHEFNAAVNMAESVCRISGHSIATSYQHSQVRSGFTGSIWHLTDKLIEAEPLL